MNFRRYAVYHLPGGPLGQFGGAWLGRDLARPVSGAEAALRPDVPGLPAPAEALTQTPRRYGFHATIKAPFRLADGHGPDDLIRRAALICDHLAPFDLALELRQDYGFVALRPTAQPPELLALEQALVTRLDDLRSPLTPDERDRRRPDALPPKARAHLDHWGYPFVLDLFHYHLTLSNSLPAPQADALVAALQPVVAPLLAQPMRVEAVSVVGEDADGLFHHIADIALRG